MFTWHGACCSCPPVEEKQVRLYLCVHLFLCVCRCESIFGSLCVCVCGLVDVYSIYVWLYVCEENEIIKIERVREWIPFNEGKMQAVSPV